MTVLPLASACVAQSAERSSTHAKPQSNLSNIGGQVFASTCAGCHGLDGRGGKRAPNVAQRREAQQRSDAELTRIVQDGIPGTGMPPFHSLTNSEVKAVVAYLRTLQGTTEPVKLPGDPDRGKAVFYGPTGCSGCHMVAGSGGFIASDLSGYGRNHSVQAIRSAITGPADQQARSAIVITRAGGQRYAGRVRNEDNFSLQFQSLDGTFHFLPKSDVESLEYGSRPLMPSDYGTSISAQDLDDLVSFLISSAKTSEPETPKNVDD